MTEQEVLAEFRAAGALLEGHFVLSSGLHSSRYLQCARVLMDPARASRLAAALVDTLPADRSLRIAYLLWFFTGLAGGHRFYLRRTLTGAAQAALFAGCVGAVFAQYYPAFAGLGLSWLWMLADGFLIRRMYRTAGAP